MKSRMITVVLFVSAFLFAFHQSAAAHGRTEAGDYELVIGFLNEPAFQDEPNGLDLSVTNKETGEPVNGLEDTLRVEIIFGSSKKELSIEPRFGRDGAYTAQVLPTEAGDYTWHIFGTIEGTPVDVSMTSGPDTFGSVEPKSSVSFPSAEASTDELVTQVNSAAGTARVALIAGGIGIVFGLLGLIFGLLGFQAARRRVA